MISFRSHVVSLVAVFLALALGVVLGAGPLRGDGNSTLVAQANADRQTTTTLRAQVKGLRSQNAFTDEFARTVGPGLLAGRLSGHVVTLVALPTAQQADLATLRGLVRAAGGTVAGTARIGSKLVDAGSKQLVDELGTQLESSTRRVHIAPDAGPYERIGTLMARALGTAKRGGAPVDSPATSIQAGLATTDLLSTRSKLTRRGDLVLFVTGSGQGDAAQRKGVSTIVTALVRAVDDATSGVVLAGPVTAARADGAVRAVRDDVGAAKVVSTVDSLGPTAGDVVTVLALAGQAAGKVGQYGAVNAADGAMPGGRTAAQ